MSEKLELYSTQMFNGDLLEYYLDTTNGDLWVTREQIGSFLGYKNPHTAITLMHKKHSDRLDKFSKRINIQYSGGNHKIVAYSFKGLLEICRWSRKPNADAVLERLCELIEKIEITNKK